MQAIPGNSAIMKLTVNGSETGAQRDRAVFDIVKLLRCREFRIGGRQLARSAPMRYTAPILRRAIGRDSRIATRYETGKLILKELRLNSKHWLHRNMPCSSHYLLGRSLLSEEGSRLVYKPRLKRRTGEKGKLKRRYLRDTSQ